MTTPQTAPDPPPLAALDAEAFRRKLAGLADPDRPGSPGTDAETRDAAARFGSVLAHLFGDALDRLTLWERIGSALESACAKVSDGDLDRFVSLCLDHVKADDGRAAACAPLGQLLSTFAVRPPEWRQGFVRYVSSRRYAVLVHSRARWESVKAKEAEL